MWNNFETSSTEDETVNNEFSTNGLFKISSDEVNTKDPHVYAVIQNKKMIISIDRSLLLIEDENIGECSFFSFGSPIDCLVVSKSSNLVICGLLDGNIHGLFLKGAPVFNLMIQEQDVGINSTFVGIHQIRDNFYIMCRSGQLYRIKNVDEKSLSEFLINIDNEAQLLSESIHNNTVLEKISKAKCNDLTNFCLIPMYNSVKADPDETINNFKHSTMILCSTSDDILFQFQTFAEKLKIPSKYRGIKSLFNWNRIMKVYFYMFKINLLTILSSFFSLALTISGDLLTICPHTKMFHPYSCKDFVIDDMVLMESDNDNLELLALTQLSEERVRMLKIIEFPSMNCIHELELDKYSWIIHQPKSSMNMYYLKGNNKGTNAVQEIEIRIISETDPANRLKKLVQRCHFNDAEEYARQFDLCPQEIYEAKARKMLREISKTKHEDKLISIYKNFISYIPKITNKKFLLSILVTDIPSRELMKSYLKYLSDNLDKTECAENMADINDQMLRLDTLNIIDPYGCYGTTEWQKFVHDKNLLKTCLNYFRSNMSIACVIWSRHSSSIVNYIKFSELEKILDDIPDKLKPFEIIQWLKHFIPSVTQKFPNSIKLLVDWCIIKTKSFQYSNLWPEIGLEFINNIHSIFSDISFFIDDMRRNYESSLNKIQAHVLSLQDVTVLKTSFNLVISLNDYMELSPQNTAFNLMKRIKLDNFKRLIDDFLHPIFMEKGLQLEDSIIRYIKYITEYKNTTFWQERAVIATELLHNEKNKLQCALHVLKAAPVPWSDQLNTLVKYGATNHPLAEDIYIEYKAQSIKLIKIKYGWPVDTGDDLLKLVYRIVKINLPEMQDDIKDLVNASPSIAENAYFYCSYEMARTGEIDKAIKFIDGLGLEDRKKCYIKTINIIAEYLNNDDFVDMDEEENMKDFMKIIASRLNDSKYDDLVKDVERINYLRRNFDINKSYEITENVVINERHFIEGMQTIVCDLISRTDSLNFLQNIIEKISILAAKLNVNIIDALFELVQYVDNIHFTCAIIYYLLSSFDFDNMNSINGLNIVVLLIAQDIKYNNHVLNDIVSYPLAYQLLVHCLRNDLTLPIDILDLLKWFRLVCDFYPLDIVEIRSMNKIEEKLAFDEISDKLSFNKMDPQEDKKKRESLSIFETTPDSCPKETNAESQGAGYVDLGPIFDIVGASLKLITVLQKNPNSIYYKFKKYFNFVEADIEDIKSNFYKYLENLFKLKHHFYAFKIIIYFLEKQNSDNFPIILSMPFVSAINRRVMKYILSQKDPNYSEALDILSIEVNKEETLNFLESVLKNGSQKYAFLILSQTYYEILENQQKFEEFKDKQIKYFYCTELCKLDNRLKTKPMNEFSIEIDSIENLFSELKHKMLDISILKRLCKDFNWDLQSVLITQIESILNKQELQFDVTSDVFGKEEIVVRTNVNEIKALCMPFVNEITNIDLFKSTMFEFFNEVNFYFYEIYICIIELIESISTIPSKIGLWKNILIFLKHKLTTKRRNRPGQMETDLWLKSKFEIGVLPNISKYRLPFKPLVDLPIEDILDAEVCIENLEKWLPLVRFTALLRNSSIIELQEHFCLVAVKNSISNYKGKSEDELSETWQLTPINNGFLQSILHMLQFLEDKVKIAFVLYFVANHAPEGADQVEASYECYKYCLENEDVLMEVQKTEEIVTKIKRKYPLFKTQHLLHLFKVSDKNLLQYVGNPTELIFSLYHHEVILKPNKPDIHKLAAELADLYSLDLHLIHMNLLNKWLRSSSESKDVDLEETMYDDFLNENDDSFSEMVYDDFVKRSMYILNAMEHEKAKNYLVYTYEASSNSAKQLLLCDCFKKLLDEDNVTYNEILNQNQYNALKICHNLKQLGYKFTTTQFIAMDKLALLKKLWQNNANNSKSLDIMAYICLAYDIHLPQIWNSILKQMSNLNMIKELTDLIDLLSTKPSLLNTQGFISAYEYVIKTQLKNASITKSFEQEQTLSKALLMLQKCPVSAQLNLKELASTCILVNRPHMAAIMLAYTDDEALKKVIMDMVLSNTTENLKKDIIELEEFGIISLTTNYVLNQLAL